MAIVIAPEPQVDKPPFVLAQGMRLLTETDNPREFLAAEYFRAGRLAAEDGHGPAQREKTGKDVWVLVDRWDVAWDRVLDSAGKPVSLHRMVFVTDAGKSARPPVAHQQG